MSKELNATRWEDVKRKRQPREEVVKQYAARMEAAERAYTLREIREAAGLTQSDMAQRMNLTQPTISALERGDLEHSGVETLRAYVTALGGGLEVVATFGSKRLVLG